MVDCDRNTEEHPSIDSGIIQGIIPWEVFSQRCARCEVIRVLGIKT